MESGFFTPEGNNKILPLVLFHEDPRCALLIETSAKLYLLMQWWKGSKREQADKQGAIIGSEI
jgi:hypothetical protein